VRRPKEAFVKPNLFIVGAAKCGTTAWHAYLREHPDIFFTEDKEPNFFATDLPGMRRNTSREAYEAEFAGARGAKAVGEASPVYLYSTAAAAAIREYNPDARILIFLRPPEDFLPSYHHHLVYRFTESIADFETAWRLSGKRPPETIPKTCRDPKLLDYGARAAFAEQVERFYAAFPAEQILVIQFSEWTVDPRGTYLRILGFLGIEDDGRVDFPRINEAKSYQVSWLGKLIAHPPRPAQLVVGALRKALGRKSLGIGTRAAAAITAPGYREKLSPELRAEIRKFYESDTARLRQLLDSRSAAAGPGSRKRSSA
jgi:hypothetical protein